MQDIKDVLIDTEVCDIINIVRVYSVVGKQQASNDFVPELFPEEDLGVEVLVKP